jgi:uncharacterized damage-inducible protein DinB
MHDSELVAYVERVNTRTREAAALLTPTQLGWRPRPGEFTAAELVTHIAAARRMNLARIMGRTAVYSGHEVPPGASPTNLLLLLYQTAAEIAAQLAAGDLSKTVTMLSGSGPAWQLVVGGLIEHEVHHRSQLCEYLSGMGVEPPALYGLHAEDLPRG